MENITLGQISVAVTFLVGLIGGIGFLHKHLKDWIGESLAGQFSKVNFELERLAGRVENVDLEACKNYLVQVLSDVERGEQMSDVALARFWEQYEHYTGIGGNSYIHRKVEQLKEEGKL